jgi:hypothetical protein
MSVFSSFLFLNPFCENLTDPYSDILFLLLKICDAVAVAKILNATLVIPHLEVNAVWQDTRYFASKLPLQPLLHSRLL